MEPKIKIMGFCSLASKSSWYLSHWWSPRTVPHACYKYTGERWDTAEAGYYMDQQPTLTFFILWWPGESCRTEHLYGWTQADLPLSSAWIGQLVQFTTRCPRLLCLVSFTMSEREKESPLISRSINDTEEFKVSKAQGIKVSRYRGLCCSEKGSIER